MVWCQYWKCPYQVCLSSLFSSLNQNIIKCISGENFYLHWDWIFKVFFFLSSISFFFKGQPTLLIRSVLFIFTSRLIIGVIMFCSVKLSEHKDLLWSVLRKSRSDWLALPRKKKSVHINNYFCPTCLFPHCAAQCTFLPFCRIKDCDFSCKKALTCSCVFLKSKLLLNREGTDVNDGTNQQHI